MPDRRLLEIGRIGRPHGVHGEVYVDLTTDVTERLAPGSRLQTAHGELVVDRARPHQHRWLVTFEGVADRNAAESLTNRVLLAEPVDVPDAVWVHELIDSTVVEANGTPRGRCIGVIASPADDILELESGALVPARFVVSCVDGITTVDVPDGLFDVFE
jgi:16S rRNA processing protein RimM